MAGWKETVECYMGPEYTYRIEEVQDGGRTVYQVHGRTSATGYTWLVGEFNTRGEARDAIVAQNQRRAKGLSEDK